MLKGKIERLSVDSMIHVLSYVDTLVDGRVLYSNTALGGPCLFLVPKQKRGWYLSYKHPTSVPASLENAQWIASLTGRGYFHPVLNEYSFGSVVYNVREIKKQVDTVLSRRHFKYGRKRIVPMDAIVNPSSVSISMISRGSRYMRSLDYHLDRGLSRAISDNAWMIDAFINVHSPLKWYTPSLIKVDVSGLSVHRDCTSLRQALITGVIVSGHFGGFYATDVVRDAFFHEHAPGYYKQALGHLATLGLRGYLQLCETTTFQALLVRTIWHRTHKVVYYVNALMGMRRRQLAECVGVSLRTLKVIGFRAAFRHFGLGDYPKCGHLISAFFCDIEVFNHSLLFMLFDLLGFSICTVLRDDNSHVFKGVVYADGILAAKRNSELPLTCLNTFMISHTREEYQAGAEFLRKNLSKIATDPRIGRILMGVDEASLHQQSPRGILEGLEQKLGYIDDLLNWDIALLLATRNMLFDPLKPDLMRVPHLVFNDDPMLSSELAFRYY